MSRRLAALVVMATLGASTAGCYKATFHLKPGVGTPSPSVNGAMHFSIINIIEVSEPVNLNTACPDGVAVRASERVGPLGAFMNIALSWVFPILAVMNPSVECAAGAAPPTPGPAQPPPVAGPPAR